MCAFTYKIRELMGAAFFLKVFQRHHCWFNWIFLIIFYYEQASGNKGSEESRMLGSGFFQFSAFLLSDLDEFSVFTLHHIMDFFHLKSCILRELFFLLIRILRNRNKLSRNPKTRVCFLQIPKKAVNNALQTFV